MSRKRDAFLHKSGSVELFRKRTHLGEEDCAAELESVTLNDEGDVRVIWKSRKKYD